MSQSDDDLYDHDQSGAAPSSSPPPTKMQNVAALGKNPKTSRVVLATAGAVVLVGAIATISIMSRNTRQPQAIPAAISGAAVGVAPTDLSQDRSKALAGSQQYADIVAASSKKRASEALASGESAQPLALTVEGSLKPAMTPAEIAERAAQMERARLEAEAAERARQAMSASQGQVNNQPVDAQYQQQQSNAQAGMIDLLKARSRGTVVIAFADGATPTSGGGAAAVQPAGAGTGMLQASVPAPPPGVASANQFTLIGAGQIESARIDTGMNTDLGGDFGATLLTGKFAGARLIGSYQRRGELAVGTIRVMALPEQGVSVPAHAVVLDAETTEGGTATDVDRKLFVKYGIKPIAAGFAAVAEYLRSSGTSITVNGETVTSTQPELTGKKTAQIILGSAAQQVHGDANALDTTPTVRVKRGSIVGVFFTSDVTYTPKS